MRSHLAAVAVVLVTVSGPIAVGPAAPAGAAADRCVTRGEYAAVRQGMTMTRVRTVVGFGGSRVSRVTASPGYIIEKRRYRLCFSRAKVAELGFVSVEGGPYKLTRKVLVAR